MFYPVNGDPFRSNVVLHLPMTGANNSTTFIDVSQTPKTITRYGDTKISTAQSKWGQGSGYFDGSGDYLTASSGFDFGTGDFTYEWLFYSGATNAYCAMATRPYFGAGGILIALNGATGNGRPIIYWREYVNDIFFESDTAGFNDSNWHHFAFVRSGTTCYLFIDGITRATKTSVSTSVGSSILVVGTDTEFGGRNYTGYLQDVRISSFARYTANFTPPAGPLASRLPELPVRRIIQPTFNQIARLGL